MSGRAVAAWLCGRQGVELYVVGGPWWRSAFWKAGPCKEGSPVDGLLGALALSRSQERRSCGCRGRGRWVAATCQPCRGLLGPRAGMPQSAGTSRGKSCVQKTRCSWLRSVLPLLSEPQMGGLLTEHMNSKMWSFLSLSSLNNKKFCILKNFYWLNGFFSPQQLFNHSVLLHFCLKKINSALPSLLNTCGCMKPEYTQPRAVLGFREICSIFMFCETLSPPVYYCMG